MVSFAVAAMSTIISVPGGPVILVPEDYATIAEAAAAIVVPQFQVIDVAPGTYDVGFVNLGGAAIRGRTGNASDVVLTNGQLEYANAKDLTLNVSFSGTAVSAVLDNCYFLGCLGTDCLVKGGAATTGRRSISPADVLDRLLPI